MSDDILRPDTNRFTSIEKRWLWVFSAIALISRAALAFRSDARIATVPYGDDAFYVFSIARNLAMGRSPSVDGVHLTNGFQPLITYLYVPIFWLCSPNDWLAIRWTLVLSGVIAAISVWLIAMLARSLLRSYHPMPLSFTAPIVAAGIWACSISLFDVTTTGLETGLYSMLLLIVMIMWVKWHPVSGVRIPFLFGLLLGLTVLARIDAAILVAILAIFLARKKQWRSVLLVSGIALLVSLPWWMFNLKEFGSLMPISGQAENIWPLGAWDNLDRLIETLTDTSLFIAYLPHTVPFLLRILSAMLVFYLWFLLLRGTDLIRKLRFETNLFSLFPFALFSLVLVIYYTFFFKAPHFIGRYLQPLRMLWIIFGAVAAPLLWEAYRNVRRPKIIAGVALLLIAVFSLAFSADRYVRFYTFTDEPELYETGLWAQQHPEEKIGMLQSGIAGFIASEKMTVPNVINLDGKVNADALHAHQQGRLPEYIRNEQITIIADQKPMIEDIASMCRQAHLYFDSVGLVGDSHMANVIQLMRRR
jgi:hypothetical protein